MLNIYRGGELTDREKFIFDHIKGKTLLLVPDQFSLQAERDAFFYLKEKSLMDQVFPFPSDIIQTFSYPDHDTVISTVLHQYIGAVSEYHISAA